jgi:hypothetical protein
MRRDSSREGKVWPARGNQRLEVKQLAIDALPHGLCFLTVAVGPAHVHPSPPAARHAQCRNFHENKSRTFSGGGQAR